MAKPLSGGAQIRSDRALSTPSVELHVSQAHRLHARLYPGTDCGPYSGPDTGRVMLMQGVLPEKRARRGAVTIRARLVVMSAAILGMAVAAVWRWRPAERLLDNMATRLCRAEEQYPNGETYRYGWLSSHELMEVSTVQGGSVSRLARYDTDRRVSVELAALQKEVL